MISNEQSINMEIDSSTIWKESEEIPNRYDFNLVFYFRHLNFALANTKSDTKYIALNRSGEKIIGFFENENHWAQNDKFVCVKLQGKCKDICTI
jgi:hypothetical protein